MTDNIPPLQYKKPSVSQQTVQSPTIAITPPPPPPQETSPQPPTTNEQVPTTQHRRVLSRRKALQDFYHIQDQSTSSTNTNEETNTTTDNENPPSVNLQDPDQLRQFIQTSKIEDILKLRNDMMYKLNSQDLEKKSIIYDNYYELIKLNDTLSDLSKKHPTKNGTTTDMLNGLQIYNDKTNDGEGDTKEIFLNNSLKELQEFVNTETKKYTGSFASVLESLQLETACADSAASIDTIRETKEDIPVDVDKQELIKEIDSLLEVRIRIGELDDDEKKVTIDNIEKILLKLTIGKHELLILQLNDLKKGISI